MSNFFVRLILLSTAFAYTILFENKSEDATSQLCIKLSNAEQFYYCILKRKHRQQTDVCSMASFFRVRVYNYFQCLLSGILRMTDSLAVMQIKTG